MPKPSMQDIASQAAPSMDTNNRFYKDNYKRLEKFDYARRQNVQCPQDVPKQPQICERGTLSSGQKVKTFCAKQYDVKTVKRPATCGASQVEREKRRDKRQVVEVDDQDQKQGKPTAEKIVVSKD